MSASFRICLSWLGGIVAAVALICLVGLETSAASEAPSASLARASIILAAQPDHVYGPAESSSGGTHHEGEGTNVSCCTSAACSSAGVTSAASSLFVIPVTNSYRAAPLDRLIPFEQSPSERPPRAA